MGPTFVDDDDEVVTAVADDGEVRPSLLATFVSASSFELHPEAANANAVEIDVDNTVTRLVNGFNGNDGGGGAGGGGDDLITRRGDPPMI
jgi:hypothetical protein